MKPKYRPEGIDTSDSEDDEYLEEEIAELPTKLKERMNRPRASVSAEVYGAYNPKTAFEPPVVEKEESTKKMLRELLVKIFMFQHLEEEDLATVIDAMSERRFSNEEDVIKQGDDGDELYVCSEGTLKCSKVFPGKFFFQKRFFYVKSLPFKLFFFIIQYFKWDKNLWFFEQFC